MQVIINVKQNSQYSRFNGLTFEVKELLPTMVGVAGINPEFPENITDFGFHEVMIVNIEKEIEYLEDIQSRNILASCKISMQNAQLRLNALYAYCREKQIKFK